MTLCTPAEQNGGGWVQLTFHHICNSCDAYSITAATMQSLLDWRNTQVTAGAVAVKTTEQVIGRDVRNTVLLLGRLWCAAV
jgi:hypothetical protein